MLPVLQELQSSSLPDKITLKQLFINFTVTQKLTTPTYGIIHIVHERMETCRLLLLIHATSDFQHREQASENNYAALRTTKHFILYQIT